MIAPTVPFARILGQPLHRLAACEPWITHSGPITGEQPLYGAIAFEFATDALVCTSPLRYMRHQGGTQLFDGETERPVNLGFRANACCTTDIARFKSLVHGPCNESCEFLPRRRWEDLRASRASLLNRKLVRTRVMMAGSMRELPRLELTFDSGKVLWLTYRRDLDGAIQLGEPGWDHGISAIGPVDFKDPFGWLLDDAPFPLLEEGRRWRHVTEYAEGFVDRRDGQRCATVKAELETLRRQHARMLKFRVYPSLHRRLNAIQHPFRDSQLALLTSSARGSRG